ncbi:MAG: hypothetical protein P9M11_01820 [Candidatus Tenebribacter burtonii]|nr:hypothetical protein [Candidatus Tenebribacter burtonii]
MKNVKQKILFINIDFRYDNSSGITVSKLVDHLPKENLFLLSTRAEQSNIDIFADKYQICKVLEVTIKKRNGKRNSLKIILRNIIGKKSYFNKLTLDSSIKKWLDRIKPDYLYFNPDRLSIILFAQEIVNYCNAKIIIHVMDDKVKVKYTGILGFFYKRKFNREFYNLVKKSSVRLSISDLMAEEFYKRYSKKFHTFHNPVDVEKWKPHIKSISALKNRKKTILYSGWIGSTSVPIFEFCEIIKSLNEFQYQITFTLYSKFSSQEVRDRIEAYSFVQINNYVSQEKLPETLTKANFLLLPLSFESKFKFTYLSMPTKTAEYMVSGVPIIVYAPERTALSQYAKRSKWGHTLTTNKKEIILKSVMNLFEDIDLQHEYSRNAIELAKERHDVKINKLRFMKILNEVEDVIFKNDN